MKLSVEEKFMVVVIELRVASPSQTSGASVGCILLSLVNVVDRSEALKVRRKQQLIGKARQLNRYYVQFNGHKIIVAMKQWQRHFDMHRKRKASPDCGVLNWKARG